ncbi:hypothetical protein AKO1_009332 [Acrasis kona]|uniref:GYF domain-containing protein n=1 Tax=Acrasis kona TaxID=1008807 RepID=A0AAW2ZKL4_9EUKA
MGQQPQKLLLAQQLGLMANQVQEFSLPLQQRLNDYVLIPTQQYARTFSKFSSIHAKREHALLNYQHDIAKYETKREKLIRKQMNSNNNQVQYVQTTQPQVQPNSRMVEMERRLEEKAQLYILENAAAKFEMKCILRQRLPTFDIALHNFAVEVSEFVNNFQVGLKNVEIDNMALYTEAPTTNLNQSVIIKTAGKKRPVTLDARHSASYLPMTAYETQNTYLTQQQQPMVDFNRMSLQPGTTFTMPQATTFETPMQTEITTTTTAVEPTFVEQVTTERFVETPIMQETIIEPVVEEEIITVVPVVQEVFEIPPAPVMQETIVEPIVQEVITVAPVQEIVLPSKSVTTQDAVIGTTTPSVAMSSPSLSPPSLNSRPMSLSSSGMSRESNTVPLEYNRGHWYYMHKNTRHGPYKFTELQRRFREGDMPEEALLSRGDVNWVPLEQFEGMRYLGYGGLNVI